MKSIIGVSAPTVGIKKTNLTHMEKELSIPNFDAESLISKAIEQKVPVETMEKLLAMRRELKAEWAKEQFDKALAAFQAECPTIEKKKKVSFNTTNYSYAPLEDIVEQVKSLLAKHGFSYSFDTREAENAIKIICNAKHIDGHSEPSSLEIAIDTAAKMNKTQQYGAANSYGKRYAFCNAFGILTGDEDTDAIATEESTAPQNVAQSQPQQATQGSIAPSKAQYNLISKLMEQKGYTKEDLIDAGFMPGTLTGGKDGTASEMIDYLLKAKSKTNPNGDPVDEDEGAWPFDDEGIGDSIPL